MLADQSQGAQDGKYETDGDRGRLFKEAEAFLPSQCVLCHEGGVGCKGGKPLGMIALMQPSTVLSAVARRQRAAKRERTEMAEEGGGDNAHVGPGPTCPTCPTSRLSADLVGEDGAAADRGDSGFGGSGLARNGDRTADKRFLCGHQMVAEASVAGWEGVCSGHGAGGEDDAAATGMVVSVCGHGMHSECLQRYLDSQRGLYLDHGAVQSEHEFMCPLCRSLGNALVFHNLNVQACTNAMKLRGGRREVSSIDSCMRVSLFVHMCVCSFVRARTLASFEH